jgi:hypothetical protein
MDELYCCGKGEDMCSKCIRNINNRKDYWRTCWTLNPNIKSNDICFDFLQ